MGSLLWGLCAFLFTFLIVYFLPIGLTKKGKIIVIIAGLLLALTGLAASSSFSLLLTLLLLLVLVFFVSYILDSRLDALLYMKNASAIQQEQKAGSFEYSFKETAGSLENSIDEITPLPPNQLSEKENSSTQLKKEAPSLNIESDDDDISFLLNRSIAVEEETKKKEDKPKHEVDYLAEIEDLLNIDSDKKPSGNKSDGQLSNAEIPALKEKDLSLKKTENLKADEAFVGLEEIPVLPYHKKESEE